MPNDDERIAKRAEITHALAQLMGTPEAEQEATALQFEDKIFKKAKNDNDYATKIRERLLKVTQTFTSAQPTAIPKGNSSTEALPAPCLEIPTKAKLSELQATHEVDIKWALEHALTEAHRARIRDRSLARSRHQEIR